MAEEEKPLSIIEKFRKSAREFAADDSGTAMDPRVAMTLGLEVFLEAFHLHLPEDVKDALMESLTVQPEQEHGKGKQK